MFVCKWCRESIRLANLAWQSHGIVWQHESGVFNCPRRPELQAEPADTRWETVWASVEDDPVFPAVKRFEIVVRYFGQRMSVVYRLSEDDLQSAHPNIFALTMEELVCAMDDRMTRMPDGR